MKKLFLSLALLCLGLCVYAQTGYVVKSSDYNRLELSFKAPAALNVENVTVKGTDFSMVTMDGFTQSSAMGCPSLPTMRCLIEAPLCSGISVRITNETHIVIDGESIGVSRRVAPVQPSECKTASRNRNILLVRDEIYSADAFYGIDLVTTAHVGVARDRNLAQVIFSPVKYNPVTNQFIVYTQVEAVLTYQNPDVEATKAMKSRYYSPAFGNGIKTINKLAGTKDVSVSAPIRYMIVANPMFRGELDEFVNWKKRTGFVVDEVYTDDAEVGNTVTSIAAYIKSQYSNATVENPAPSFLLFVGDLEQLPAETVEKTTVYIPGWWEETETQVSDLIYSCWTDGDSIPDCYYGRLSAQTVEQLTPQLDKILFYERYEFPDPSFLDVAMLVSGIDQGSSNDHGYTHCDPTMDYVAKFYVNGDYGYTNVYEYKNKTTIDPNAPNVTVASNATSNAAAIRAKYSEGAGWINYSAHGDWDRWYSPELTCTQVSQMTNQNKCGIMIGNCCLSGKFDESTCFAEALLRQGNNCGAAAYIGASNSTYWDQDFYWAVGVRTSISGSMNHQYMADKLGMYDLLFHTHDEDHSLWAPTLGSMLFNGNMAVETSNSDDEDKLYYWQIYHVFGDPSMMPWLTQAGDMTVTYDGLFNGSTSVTVTSVPYAYVALTGEDYTFYGAAFADDNGVATLNLSRPLPLGSYVLAASAQNYKTALVNVNVVDVTYSITVISDDQSMGSVYGGGTYNEYSTAVISASSNDGYHFVRWNDNDLNATRTVLVTADSTFTAYFEANNPDDTYYSVTVRSDNETMGTASGSGQYIENSTITISANPLRGYRFVRWDDNSTEAIRQVTVTSDVVYTAYFEVDPLQGIDDAVANSAKIYPNPTTGILHVELDGLDKVEVIDVVGRVVISQTSDGTVNMSALNNGIYTLRLFAGDTVTVKKVVKK